MEFPTALLGAALGTILLPSLSKAHVDADPVEYSALLDWGAAHHVPDGGAQWSRAVFLCCSADGDAVPLR